jgi:hypothetical protein
MKKTLYHGTSVKNVDSILETGLKQSVFEQAVYLTESAESAARWTGFKLSAMGEDTLAVIEVIVDEDRLSPGMDHSPLMQSMFGAGESILHEGDIKPSDILNVIYFGKKV